MRATAAFCGVVILGTITSAIFLGTAISRADQRLTQSKAELKALTAEHAARVAALERQKNLVIAIRGRDKPVKEVIEFLAASISRRSCLTTLAVENNGTIFMSGEATNPRVVADLMDTINLSPMLAPVRLNTLNRLGEQAGGQGLHFDIETAILHEPVAASPEQAGTKTVTLNSGDSGPAVGGKQPAAGSGGT
jgi:Predicted secreted endonuclease distantly related to archaeal Holliday junction resolvase